jgi:murein DD-endopeptidase MepM/ murein hydrolase activator NlpD
LELTFFVILAKTFFMKFVALFVIFSVSVSAQNLNPKDYFRPPMDIPMLLSGNFGELRPNHFHAGFDLKTNKVEGQKVYACADGYVSRIKISIYGYGKAIYITHPNGYVTVYGHLQRASGAIQDYIVAEQYKQKEYEIEVFPKQNELMVKKGDLIALSGNTGGSEGPHLHFEIRNVYTEKVINPSSFFDIKDTKKPIISSLLAYPIDENSVVNESMRPVILGLALQKDGTYLSDKVFANGRIGFGVSSVDTDDVSFNSNGVFRTQLLSNGKLVYGYEFDEMAFDEARYINAFIDYSRYKVSKQRVQKLFMKESYGLSNVKKNEDDGMFNVTPNFSQMQHLEVSDFKNNTTVVSIPMQYSDKPALISEDIKKTKYFVKYKNDASFEKDNVSVFFPANTFYEDFYLNFDVNGNDLFLHDDSVPLHSNFTISIEDKASTAEQKKKMFIAAKNGKKLGYIATKVNGNTFSCRTRSLGQFTLAKDITAPKITIAKPVEGKLVTSKSIQLSISDDLSGINSYVAYMNGKWVLFEYESKTRKITHFFDDNYVVDGDNILKVIVTDNVGNSTTFETKFKRNKTK